MSNLKIAARKQPAQFQPGEEIAGAAQWRLNRAPAAVEVRLLWRAKGSSGSDIEDVCIVDTARFDSLLADDTRPFQFTAPDAPYSFIGRLISLDWFLELVALPSNDNTRIQIIISPDGERVSAGRLEPAADEPGAQ